ncbi:HPGDS [Acanthosepion pharaonis]|uniref:HPGDS n=1 Tax=Acanthosepion pharaonis TaxID=158019 RepID=A0A812C3Y5_ACAPH|nr:HPGDS [Sepia pharaonis]
MPNYTLHYFNGRGRAEIIRMMFNMAGVPYNDKRYEFSEWDRCRNDYPGMCLPCLEMDGGMRMPETMAICRYLAREFVSLSLSLSLCLYLFLILSNLIQPDNYLSNYLRRFISIYLSIYLSIYFYLSIYQIYLYLSKSIYIIYPYSSIYLSI